jgi:FkbM family methyltransferase
VAGLSAGPARKDVAMAHRVIHWAASAVPLALRFRLIFYPQFLRRQAHTLPFVADLIDPRRACMDVGANVGFFTEFMARRARHVYAYEPNPALAFWLQRCRRRNVTPYFVALGAAPGQAVLRVPGAGGGLDGLATLRLGAYGDGPGVDYTVPVERLDDRAFEDIGFIKIDAEGFEDAVLDGARDLLARAKPNLFIEIEQRHRSSPVAACVARLTGMGYAAHFIWEGRLHPFADFRVEVHQNPQFAGTAGYAGDFLFRPMDRI